MEQVFNFSKASRILRKLLQMRRPLIQVVLIASEFSNTVTKTYEHPKTGCHIGIDLPAVAAKETF